MKIRDRVLEIYPDNVSTDAIVPTRLVTDVTPEKLAVIAMKDQDVDFHEKLKRGKIMVAGRNFGYASSREYAPLALKASGVRAIRASPVAVLNSMESKLFPVGARLRDSFKNTFR